jgi:hypothetical protein
LGECRNLTANTEESISSESRRTALFGRDQIRTLAA